MSDPSTIQEAMTEIRRLERQVAILRECLGDSVEPTPIPSETLVDHAESARILRELIKGTDPATGTEFFPSLVQHLAAALQMKYAVVWSFADQARSRMKSLAVWAGTGFGDNFEGPIPGSPCEKTVEARRLCAFPSGVRQQFPDVAILAALGIESYFAAPLFDHQGEVVGNLVVMHDQPKQLTSEQESILELFAGRAGSEWGRQRAEMELTRNEAYFRALIEQALDIVTVLSPDGTVRYQSPSLERVMGWRPEERIGRHGFEHVHPDDLELGQTTLRAVLEHPGEIRTGEFRLRHRDGSWRTLEAVGRATAHLDGALCVIVNMRDITERKRVELERLQALQDLRNIMETVPDFMFTLDISGKLVRWNSPVSVVTGYRDEELTNKPALEFVAPDEQEQTALAIQRAFMDGYAELDGHLRTKEGRLIPYHWTGAVLKNPQGQTIGITGVGRDVSERKRTEEEIRRQRQHLLDAQALAHLGSWEWEIDSGQVLWSDEQYRIFGYEPGSQAVTYDTFLTALLPEDHDRVLAALNVALQGKVPYEIVCRIVRPNSDIRHIHCRGDVWRDGAGRPIRMSGTSLDVTERVLVEDALRASEARWQLAVQGSNDGIWDWNITTGEVFFSSRWKAMRGFEPHEVTHSLNEWRSRIHPDDLPRVLERLEQYLNRRCSEYCEEYRVERKDGSYMWVLDRGVALWDEQGTAVRMAGSESDITERKQAESALRESEERYRMLVDLSPSGIFVFDGENTVYVNQAACCLLGASRPEEILNRPTFDFIHPDCHAAVLESARSLLATGRPVRRAERRYLKMDGVAIDVEIDAAPIIWNGRPAIQGIFADITERKRAEAALREMNFALAQAMPGIARIDSNGHYSAVNDSYAAMLGCAPGDLIGQSWEPTVHEEDRPLALAAYTRMIEEGKAEFEARAVRKDESIFYKQVLIVKGFNTSDGGHHCFMRDISERKEMERQQTEQAERLRLAMEIAEVATWDWDLLTNRVVWSENCERIKRLPPGTFQGTFDAYLQLVHPEDRPRLHGEIRGALAGDQVYHTEHRLLPPDGIVQWVEGNGVVYCDDMGRPIRMVGTVRNMTERKRAEEALRNSEEKLRQALHASNTGLWDWNTESNETSFSREWKRQLGYDESELLDAFETWESLLHPEDQNRAISYARAYLADPAGDYHQEFRLRHKDGTYRWIAARASFIAEPNGRRIRLLGSHTDVTDRKRGEEQLQLTQFTMDRLSEAIFWIRPDAHIAYVNDAACRMLGYTRDELVSMSVTEIDSHFSAETWPSHWEELKKQERYTFESTHQKKGGACFHAEVTVNYLRFDGQEYNCALMRDITERKRAEEALRASEELFSKAFRSSPDPMVLVELESGLWLDVNDACLAGLGHRRADVIGRTGDEIGHWIATQDRRRFVQQLKEAGSVRNFEGTFQTSSGERRDCLVSAELIEYHGKACMIVLSKDITERKQAEAALRASEERYARATAVGKVGVWDLDVLRGLYHGDANLKAMFGYAADELSTDPYAWLNVVWPEDRPIAMAAWERVVAGTTNQYVYEIRIQRKDGSLFWTEVRGHAVRDEHGNVIRLIGATTDISERKQAQESLDALVRGTAAVTGYAFFPIFVKELAAALGVKYAAVTDLKGVPPTALKTRALWVGADWGEDFEYQLSNTPCEVVVREGLACYPSSVQETFPQDRDLTMMRAESYLGILLRNEEGAPLGHIFVIDEKPLIDPPRATAILQIFAARATAELERLRADEALVKRERELRTVLDALPIGVWFTDPTGKPVLSNPASKTIWSNVKGVEFESPSGNHAWKEVTDYANQPHRWALSRVLTRGEASLHDTFELECEGGVRKTILNSAVPVRDDNGAILGALVLNEDITDRIRAEEALRQNHALLSAIMEASVDLIYVKDLQGRYVHMNQAGAQVLGMPVDEIVGWDDVALWGSELAASCKEADRQVLVSGHTITVEECDATHGKRTYYLTTKAPYRDSEGRIVGIIGVSRDITERKQAELERESRYAELHAIFGMTVALARASSLPEIYEQALNGVKQALKADRASILLFDRDGTMRFQAWRGLSEVYRKAVDGHSPWLAGAKDPKPIVVTDVATDQTVASYRDVFLAEGFRALAFIPLMSPEGLVGKFMLYYNQPHDFTDHEIGVAQTIAGHVAYCIQRTKDQEALRTSEERFAKAFRASLHPVVIAELDSGLVLEANDAAYQLFNYSKEEVAGHTTIQIGLWPSVEARNRFVSLLKKEGSVRNLEVSLRTRDGVFRQCLLSSELIELDGKQCLVTVGNDITDRKRAEEELQRSHAFLRQVLDIDPNFIFAKDHGGRFALVNKAVADAYGTTVSELIGKTDADFNPNAAEVEFFRKKDLEVMDSLQERFIPEEVITDAGGKRRWLQTVKRPILDEQGRAAMVLGVSSDITERKRMEEELRKRERDLRAAIDEREQISQDLHDGILQSLYAVGLRLETCRPLLKKLRAKKVTDTLNRVIEQLNGVMGEVRAFIAGLETEHWRKGDLPSAIRTMVQALAEPHETRYRVSIDPSVNRKLRPEQGLHVFSIVKEAMSNSLRHGHATRATITMRSVKDGLRLTIQDNGVGFDPGLLKRGVGRGLTNMTSRAARLGGRFEVLSKPHRGTKITLELPKEAVHATS